MQTKTARSKPILCLDFDGVINSYSSGWQGPTEIPDPPTAGALRWIWAASQYWKIAIFSSRSGESGGIEAMKRWFRQEVAREFKESGKESGVWWEPWKTDSRMAGANSFEECLEIYMSKLWFPTAKPPALLSIDDRAVQFTGDWTQFDPQTLLSFKPWYQREQGREQGREQRVWTKEDEREAKEKA